MTLLSTISNEAINENLKKRFENAEIYVKSILTHISLNRRQRTEIILPVLLI